MVEFGGWEMPLQYQGIIPEHHNVRQRVGLFDVSHMGQIEVSGPEAEPFLDYLCTNRISGKPDFSAIYTVLPSANGGSIDDAIIYKQNRNLLFVVCNASNREKDLRHIQHEAKSFRVSIKDHFQEKGILAIQGPMALAIVNQLFPEAANLKTMHFCLVPYRGEEVILSCTGYTGAGGFEIYLSNALLPNLWDELLKMGIPYGIMPVGLGARDTLRLEMGYALYGHEITDTIAPTESVSAWTVKWDKGDFLGKSALESLEKNPKKRSEYGAILIEPGIARAGYEVSMEGQVIGTVTSGTHSPTLNQAIAIILVDRHLEDGAFVEIKIRDRKCKAEVTRLPFIKT